MKITPISSAVQIFGSKESPKAAHHDLKSNFWFEPEPNIGTIAGAILDAKVEDFGDVVFLSRINDIFDSLKKTVEKDENPFNCMICSREAGLPGRFVYLAAHPHKMIDPVITRASETVFIKDVAVPFGENPYIVRYFVPDEIEVEYMEIDPDYESDTAGKLHRITFSGYMAYRMLMVMEYLDGFPRYRKCIENAPIEEKNEPSPQKSFLSRLKQRFTK